MPRGHSRLKTKKKKIRRLGLLITTFVFMIIGYQNCNQEGIINFESKNVKINTPLKMFLGKAQLDTGCTNLKLYDSCVFLKNPVFQNKASLTSTEERDLVPALQKMLTFGIQLSDQTNPAILKNPSFTIRSTKGGQASPLPDGSWKFPVDDPEHRLAQVMAYFYANSTIKQITQMTGQFYASNRDIKIIVDASQTGWSSKSNEIDLELVGGALDASFDAGILIFLLSQANIYYATQGRIEDLNSDQNHINCGPNDGSILYIKDCCATKYGCSKAIANGASDYLVALMFQESPTVGEFWTNRSSGMGFCGISRDLRLAHNLNADDVYNACSSSALGEVFVEGTLYASVWWEVRKKVQALGPELVNQLDQLYTQHLAKLTPDDTFPTVLNKIKNLDATAFNSKFSQLFIDEYIKRNLM